MTASRRLGAPVTRRTALATIAAAAAAACVSHRHGTQPARNRIRISLAQWSLHRPLFDDRMTNLDFPAEAAAMGFHAVEYVSPFFADKARDDTYLAQLNARARDAGVYQHLIMVDGEGRLGAPDPTERTEAVENHLKWLDAAATLGCATIRVNAASEGSWEEQQRLAADGLRRLTEHAAPMNLNVVVENHGGLTSNGQWLAETIRRVGHPNCGTLPDFGNFCFDWSRSDDPDQWYDRYKGVRQLIPYAKAVSAKSYDFDEAGNETTIDYTRMLRIVLDAGYQGWIGVEYEGKDRDPREGILLTRALIERTLARLTA